MDGVSKLGAEKDQCSNLVLPLLWPTLLRRRGRRSFRSQCAIIINLPRHHHQRLARLLPPFCQISKSESTKHQSRQAADKLCSVPRSHLRSIRSSASLACITSLQQHLSSNRTRTHTQHNTYTVSSNICTSTPGRRLDYPICLKVYF